MAPSTRSTPKRIRPPRKSTTKRRNEERTALLQEIETLVDQLRYVRQDTSQPSTGKEDPPTNTVSEQLYQQLHQVETDHDLWIAGLRGFLRSYEASQQRQPLRVPLVLSTDPVQRREMLRQLHTAKIRTAHAFLVRQCGSLDLTVPYVSMDKTQDPTTGTHTTTSLEILPFPGIHSVRRVFDAMRFWMSNVEICITERLGSLTIREDDEDDGTTDRGNMYSSLRRVRSTLDCGATIEGNLAVFRQLFEPENKESSAVFTVQPVDEDPLFPYHPKDYLRVELTGAMLMSKPTPESSVVLIRWVTLRLLNSRTGTVTPEQAAAVSQDTARWFQVLNQVIQERVYANINSAS